MRHFAKGLLCFLLIACLLSIQFTACTESADPPQKEHPDISATDFCFDLSMDVSGFPDSDRKLLQGFADLVNLLTVKGTLQLANDKNGCFDADGCVILHGKNKDCEIPVHLYGNRGHWMIESPVLGDEMTIMLNLDGFLEFSMKAFSYLNVPMQNAVLWLIPYTTLRPLQILKNSAKKLLTSHTTGIVKRSTVVGAAKRWSSLFENNHTVHYWLMALGNESGYDEMLLEDLADLNTYVRSFVPKDGIQVEATDSGEVWKAGNKTLFTREVRENAEKWKLSLPKTPVGAFRTEASFEKTTEENLLQCAGKLSIKSFEMGTAIDLSVKCENFPVTLPVSAPFSADLDVKGEMRPEEHVVLSGQGDGTGKVTFTLTTGGLDFLTLNGTMTEGTPTLDAHITNAQAMKGFNLLSINDASMREFLNKVSGPLVHELLPAMIEVPASTYQSFLDFLSKYGILTMLTYGMSGE